MIERPISFNSEMVRAILDGRKTQTRRPVKPQPTMDCATGVRKWEGDPRLLLRFYLKNNRCPFGVPGDRLWVREAWRVSSAQDKLPPLRLPRGLAIEYPASENPQYLDGRIRSRRHMPRWASRITLEVTGVMLERVQDIRMDGAIAEGMPGPYHRGDFVKLWGQIYKDEYNWSANPWVWVVEFKREEGER